MHRSGLECSFPLPAVFRFFFVYNCQSILLKRILAFGLLVLSVFCVAPSFAAPAAPEIGANHTIDDLRRIESTIKYNEPADPYFGYIKGTIPVLISAPHGAKHYRTRETRLKGEDAYTASIAVKLGRMTGAYVLYVKNRAYEDPNNDYYTEYKDFLRKVVEKNHIRFVMDLHGSDPGRPYSVDVGTFSRSIDNCSCPNQLETIAHALAGLDGVSYNRRFTAHGRGTITYFAHKQLGIDAAQFEINAHYRIPSVEPTSPKVIANASRIDSVLQALQKVVLAVNSTPSARAVLPPPSVRTPKTP